MMYYSEKTAAKLLNSMFAGVEESREVLRHAWIDGAGRMCACDGFRAYRLNVPVAGVPDIETEKGVNLDNIYPPVDEGKALELPSLQEVRAMIDEDRRKAKRGEEATNLYTFGTNEAGELLPAVNLVYLADMLQMYPDARAYYGTPVSPIVFKSENGDGLVLPVRTANGGERRRAPAPVKVDKTPALGLRTFAALYA